MCARAGGTAGLTELQRETAREAGHACPSSCDGQHPASSGCLCSSRPSGPRRNGMHPSLLLLPRASWSSELAPQSGWSMGQAAGQLTGAQLNRPAELPDRWATGLCRCQAPARRAGLRCLSGCMHATARGEGLCSRGRPCLQASGGRCGDIVPSPVAVCVWVLHSPGHTGRATQGSVCVREGEGQVAEVPDPVRPWDPLHRVCGGVPDSITGSPVPQTVPSLSWQEVAGGRVGAWLYRLGGQRSEGRARLQRPSPRTLC